jgi:iron complex transport system ATP-binding protein
MFLDSERAVPTLVLVTHHVEEIMPVFSHLLVLKSGKVLAAGEKSFQCVWNENAIAADRKSLCVECHDEVSRNDVSEIIQP